jgi:NhaP-type Na+/H+ or K+/H+ antiporter
VKQFLEYVESFAVINLVLFGITGFSYHLFRDDGWIEAALGNVWDVTVQYPLIALPVMVAAAILGRTWNQARLVHGHISKLPDFVIYALMAAGAVFVVRYFWYGNL